MRLIVCCDVYAYRWRQQHEYLEKLNMQALLNASQNEDEFVKEFLINHEKVSNLGFFLHIFKFSDFVQ